MKTPKPVRRPDWHADLRSLLPCGDAMEWAERFRSAQAAWDACERGDWMLWVLGRLVGPPDSDSRRKLVLTACKCARLSLKQATSGDDRPREAIETAEAWARKQRGVVIGDVRTAADAAASAAIAAASAAIAASAANAAAIAASAASAANAAIAANAAANAAIAASAASAAADAASARANILKRCAYIVRKAYPTAPSLRRGDA